MPWTTVTLVKSAWGFLLDRAAASRRGALLWVLAIAVEKQLPLVPVLEAFADDSRGLWRTRTLELAAALRSGVSLPDALQELPGVVPNSAVLAARVGAESGTLGPALRVAAETFTLRQEVSLTAPRGVLVYLFVLSNVLLIVLTFLMVAIIPKFRVIFADFNTELPSLTLTLIGVVDAISTYIFLFIPFLFILYAASVVAFFLSVTSFEGRSLLARVIPGMAAPDVLRSLAVVIRAGRPLGSALSSLVTHHPDRSIRRRLFGVEKEVRSGGEIWHSLAQSGLIRAADASVLASAQRAGNLPWALTGIAGNIERRTAFRLQALLEFVRPVALLVFGLAVGVVVVGMFLPLLKLVNDLT